MPGTPPPVTSEAEGLLAYLRQQRAGLANAAFGLTDDQLRATPTVSALSVGGLLKHAAHTEQQWVDMIAGRPAVSPESYYDSFSLREGDSVVSLSAELDRVGAATEATVAGVADLGQEVELAEGPWFPTGGGYTVRWVLLHVLEELSRHAGHADIVREHLDGATMYELMAGVEGWPASEWITPWRPPAG